MLMEQELIIVLKINNDEKKCLFDAPVRAAF